MSTAEVVSHFFGREVVRSNCYISVGKCVMSNVAIVPWLHSADLLLLPVSYELPSNPTLTELEVPSGLV